MVQVAFDLARRLREELGVYQASEWDRFAATLGVRCVEQPALPAWQPAMLVHRTLYFRPDAPQSELSWWAFHELAHLVRHPGNFQFWESLPWGDLVLSKQEHLASEFALLFPVWDV